MREHIIESFTDYIKHVENECCEEDIFFRGQQQDWTLLPKIARVKCQKRIRPTEYKMIQDLLRIGHPYLGDIQSINENREICIDPLVFAQHNGMATRLLDWTLNPLAALWFAVRKTPNRNKEGQYLPGIVWIFCPNSECKIIKSSGSAFPTKGIYVHRPNHVTPQIAAQQGLFTLHGYDEEGEGFIPMENHKPECNLLIKIIIPGEKFSALRFQLDRCGINEASMFPGVEGLCCHIEWYHTLSEDEEE